VANWETFRELERGLTMYGQMTAGSWIYIGTQGFSRHVRDFAELARQDFAEPCRASDADCRPGGMAARSRWP